MFGREEIEAKLSRLLDLVEGEDRAVKALERQVERLEKQNEELFDKLMARNYEEYALGREGKKVVAEMTTELRPEEDDAFAGEIMEIADDTEK